MTMEYWFRQGSEPMFPDLIWSRPENKRLAGKLLIIGGHLESFAAPAEAYAAAFKAGIGEAHVLLPESLVKTVGQLFQEAKFAPSNASGSFASVALAEILDYSSQTDAVLLAGDFGKNSETTILLEKLIDKYNGKITLVGDSLEPFVAQPDKLLARAGTLVTPSFSQLQKLATSQGIAITSQMNLLQLVERLHDLESTSQASWLLARPDQVIAAASGQVSSTTTSASISEVWLATTATVWWLQNSARPFEAITSAIYSCSVPSL